MRAYADTYSHKHHFTATSKLINNYNINPGGKWKKKIISLNLFPTAANKMGRGNTWKKLLSGYVVV